LAVADCVAVAPFGATSVNVTLAPEAGSPPLKTEAAIGTEPGRENVVPEMLTVAVSDGAATTVAFAVSVVFELDVEAVRLTA